MKRELRGGKSRCCPWACRLKLFRYGIKVRVVAMMVAVLVMSLLAVVVVLPSLQQQVLLVQVHAFTLHHDRHHHRHHVHHRSTNTATSTKARNTATTLHAHEPKRNAIVMTIPVLGPILNSPPILVGEDYYLDCPSPLQWNTIEECLHNHQLYVKESEENQHETDGVVGIDAAPIVAFMDTITSQQSMDRKYNTKYATIAAIVGITTASSSSNGGKDSDGGVGYNNEIDTSSTTSFMESLQSITSSTSTTTTKIQPLQSRIRFVGIGRATLKGFHSRLPNSYWQKRDNYYNDDDNTGNDNTHNRHHHKEVEEIPLLMAQFSLLTDTDQRSELARQQQLGTNYKQYRLTRYVSPVHALAEMSQWSFKLNYVHNDRQRLIRGLKAAQIRLQQKQRKLQRQEDEERQQQEEDGLEDHDGIGQLFSSGYDLSDEEVMLSTTTSTTTMTPSPSSIQEDIQMLLQEFASEAAANYEESTKHRQNALDQVLQMENYGLGNTAAAFSSIPPLTRMLIDKLQAYYSPTKSSTEEHYYEIQSFMAILSLRYYSKISKEEFYNTALKCTNTMERMSYAYEKMVEHQLLLKQASEEISAMLLDCGEECTDLW